MAKVRLKQLDKLVIFGFIRTNSNLQPYIIAKLIYLFLCYRRRNKLFDFTDMFSKFIVLSHGYRMLKRISLTDWYNNVNFRFQCDRITIMNVTIHPKKLLYSISYQSGVFGGLKSFGFGPWRLRSPRPGTSIFLKLELYLKPNGRIVGNITINDSGFNHVGEVSFQLKANKKNEDLVVYFEWDGKGARKCHIDSTMILDETECKFIF